MHLFFTLPGAVQSRPITFQGIGSGTRHPVELDLREPVPVGLFSASAPPLRIAMGVGEVRGMGTATGSAI